MQIANYILYSMPIDAMTTKTIPRTLVIYISKTTIVSQCLGAVDKTTS